MMAYEREPSPTARDRTLHNVSQRSILLDEIKVCRRELLEPVTQISNYGHGFQEHFRQDNRGAEVQINAAAIKLIDERTEKPEIMMSSLASRSSIDIRMYVNDISSNSYVNGDGNPIIISCGQQRQLRVRRVQ